MAGNGEKHTSFPGTHDVFLNDMKESDLSSYDIVPVEGTQTDTLFDDTMRHETRRGKNTSSNSSGKDKRMVTYLEEDVAGFDDVSYDGETVFSRWVEKMEDAVFEFLTKHRRWIMNCFYFAILLVYLVYFGYCINYRYDDEGSTILIALTVFLLYKVLVKCLDSRGIVVGIPKSFYSLAKSRGGKRCRKIARYLSGTAVTLLIVIYLAVDIFPHSNSNLQAFFGMLAMILLCFIFSTKPSRVNWHPVFWSFVIQFILAFLTLRTQIGRDLFHWLGELVRTLFEFSDVGSMFVIGKEFKTWGLALSASGIIIFINAFISLLNHWGVIEYIVLNLGGFLSFCLETGPVESVVSAANVFMTLLEAPLMIRPYLPTVTKSELHAIMTCGFASISGGAVGIFMKMGAPPNHLLTASVISAPAALAISKLVCPETERVRHDVQSDIKIVNKKESNSLSAFVDGAVMAVSVCAAVWSNMLAFVSMISLMDALAGWLGDRAGVHGLTFGVICSYVLFPLAYVMGVDVPDCRKFGELLGVKLFATPFISYQRLGFLIENRRVFENYILPSSPNNTLPWHWSGDDIFLEASNTTLVGGIIAERTEVIATYAMCGFSAFSAIGVCLGALVPLCPSRKQDIINLIVRAFIAGNVASFATGAVAGVLFQSGDVS